MWEWQGFKGEILDKRKGSSGMINLTAYESKGNSNFFKC